MVACYFAIMGWICFGRRFNCTCLGYSSIKGSFIVTRNIFVFGSNLAGRHGKGAALEAKERHGAMYGQGEGLQGNSYAIPTKDRKLKSLPLDEISKHVRTFLYFATDHPELNFMVTPIGCGLAGHSRYDIAPMFMQYPAKWYFNDTYEPGNVKLPEEFKTVLKRHSLC
jgi:hypothetical protein